MEQENENKPSCLAGVSGSALDVVHWVIIKVYDKRGGLGNLIELIEWQKLPFELRIKYDWYFKYRAALLQVKYPKYIVDFFWGNQPAQGQELDYIIKKKKTAQKAKITKSKNKLLAFQAEFESYKKSYSKLFPIENEQEYKMFAASIELAENKIVKLEQELNLVLYDRQRS